MIKNEYSEVREAIIKDVKDDFIGPALGDEEILTDNPIQIYATGILYPQAARVNLHEINAESRMLSETKHSLELPDDVDNNNKSDDSLGDDNNDDEDITINSNYKLPSSCGINFFVSKDTDTFKVNVQWGKYEKAANKSWKRSLVKIPKEITLKDGVQIISIAEKVSLYVIDSPMEISQYRMVSLYLLNENSNGTKYVDPEKTLFQVHIEVLGCNNKSIFISEQFVRKQELNEQLLYFNKPIFGHGYSCAVNWENDNNKYAKKISTTFIPEHEINKVSTKLLNTNITDDDLSVINIANDKQAAIITFNNLADEYDKWINDLTIPSELKSYATQFQNNIDKCKQALHRIRKGINLLDSNETAWQSFQFMNRVMAMQSEMKLLSQSPNPSLDELIRLYEHSKFSWRPFQIAFILLNIESFVDPSSKDREIVDLLWFPTGGGKTEAYLGISAFLLAYRRLTASKETEYQKDGGVTIIIRYTLRLLTTQQRDRLLKMICAAEILKSRLNLNLGKSRFSMGFWVGASVTVNSFSTFDSRYNDRYTINKNRDQVESQIIVCPVCGSKVTHDIDEKDKSHIITCNNNECFFHNPKTSIPVHLIDEDIYHHCPSIIIGTVDKFAQLPLNDKTCALFGNVDRYCPRHGYLYPNENHSKSHNKSGNKPAVKVDATIKPFFPPELIIQDELHLITGPLGTIYGGYETIVENLCTVEKDGFKILPKYIASTATIKNSDKHIRDIYARNDSEVFPPMGIHTEDSFFSRELPIKDNPFRKYIGVCAPGKSMKYVIAKLYAVLLQSTENLLQKGYAGDIIDPYRTLIGYFNSIRELGGTVRLVADDVQERLKIINTFYKNPQKRYLSIYKVEEITSRKTSKEIPKILSKLEYKYNKCYDVVLATNMISVGMDINRLGLLSVTGQPKTTSEYIQATSRVGREYPGLIVSIYSPYKPRDLSHYENFIGYHTRLYSYVEGNTATPFSARARERTLHAILIGMLRLKNNDLLPNRGANEFRDFIKNNPEEVENVINMIEERASTIDYSAKSDTLKEIKYILDHWTKLCCCDKKLQYKYNFRKKFTEMKEFNSLTCDYNDENINAFKTLNSMRGVEGTTGFKYFC